MVSIVCPTTKLSCFEPRACAFVMHPIHRINSHTNWLARRLSLEAFHCLSVRGAGSASENAVNHNLNENLVQLYCTKSSTSAKSREKVFMFFDKCPPLCGSLQIMFCQLVGKSTTSLTNIQPSTAVFANVPKLIRKSTYLTNVRPSAAFAT